MFSVEEARWQWQWWCSRSEHVEVGGGTQEGEEKEEEREETEAGRDRSWGYWRSSSWRRYWGEFISGRFRAFSRKLSLSSLYVASEGVVLRNKKGGMHEWSDRTLHCCQPTCVLHTFTSINNSSFHSHLMRFWLKFCVTQVTESTKKKKKKKKSKDADGGSEWTAGLLERICHGIRHLLYSVIWLWDQTSVGQCDLVMISLCLRFKLLDGQVTSDAFLCCTC